MFRGEQVDAGEVSDIDRYVGVPMIDFCRLVGGLTAPQLLEGGKEYSALRNLR